MNVRNINRVGMSNAVGGATMQSTQGPRRRRTVRRHTPCLRSIVTTAATILLLSVTATTTTIMVGAVESYSSMMEIPLLDMPPLPYAESNLEPYISSENVEFHYGEHHSTYVSQTNAMISELLQTDRAAKHLKTLEDVMMYASTYQQVELYNNAAQSWNHEFYWNCMKSPFDRDDLESYNELHEQIINSFGNTDNFFVEFERVGGSSYGGGWAWLVYHPGNEVAGAASNKTLSIIRTSGAENPLVPIGQKKQLQGGFPLLAMDVWEHAYYMDYEHMRDLYMGNFLTELVNWEFVATNLQHVLASFDNNDYDDADYHYDDDFVRVEL